MSKSLSLKVFKYRSYTPIPFLVLMVLYASPNVYSLIAGFIIAGIGELIRLWGVSWAGSETRTTGAVGGTFLIISGPFAYVRNPLYVGNILIYTGFGFMSNALFPFLPVIALIFFTWQYHTIVYEEEGYLRKAFGAAYEEYFQKVPRYLPGFTPYKNKSVEQPEFDLREGLKSEKRTLQAFSIVVITILLLWFFRRLS